jgi:tetratricopeptide (TPR) repeat protein
MRRVRFVTCLVALPALASVAFAQSKAAMPSPGELVRKGVEVAETGEYDAAIHNFDEAIRIDAKFAPAYENRGIVELAKGDLDRAIGDFDEAIKLDPKNPLAFSNRGQAHRAKGDSARAIADFDQAIKLEPRYARAYYNRGTVYASQGDHRRAVADFQESIRLDPEDPSPYNSAAWILASCPADDCRNGKQAVELATKACSLTGWTQPDLLDTLGVAYAEAGDFESAINFENRALQYPKWAEREGDGARKRLELYKEKKPYREPTH